MAPFDVTLPANETASPQVGAVLRSRFAGSSVGMVDPLGLGYACV